MAQEHNYQNCDRILHYKAVIRMKDGRTLIGGVWTKSGKHTSINGNTPISVKLNYKTKEWEEQ